MGRGCSIEVERTLRNREVVNSNPAGVGLFISSLSSQWCVINLGPEGGAMLSCAAGGKGSLICTD